MNTQRKHRGVSHDLFEAIRQRLHSVLLHRIPLRSVRAAKNKGNSKEDNVIVQLASMPG
jgi:hypothetical protein